MRFSFNAALEREEKGRCSHQEQRPSPGDFVQKFSHFRASAENPVLNQATVDISYPVGRPPLSRQPFLMLGLNETIPVGIASSILQTDREANLVEFDATTALAGYTFRCEG